MIKTCSNVNVVNRGQIILINSLSKYYKVKIAYCLLSTLVKL